MKTFRLTLAYDGTDFFGWQVQPGRRTVQGVLRQALRQVLGAESLMVQGAGRTDTGVHARGQVASFHADTRLPARAIAAQVNKRLPGDVRICDAAEAPAGFHARHSARARRYAYRLLWAPDLLAERFAWHPPHAFDPEALDRASRVLEGEHDFRSFESGGSRSAHPELRVFRSRWRTSPGGIQLDIVANRFLYHMVRGVVATALEASRTADPAGRMRAVLLACDRSAAGRIAPAHGLSLEAVHYEPGDAP